MPNAGRLMIPVWRGSANTWDCDEMGHMNVRVYVEKAMEGLAGLAHAIDMPHAFRPNAPSTLVPADQHIRFMREVRPGRPLTMDACILDIGDTDMVVYQELRHGDGSYAAVFRTRIIHADAKSGRAFPWARRTRAKLEALVNSPPKATAPRSIAWPARALSDDDATLDRVAIVGAPCIGIGAVPAHHTDLHGRMRPEWVMGRISDAVPNLLADWRDQVASGVDGARAGAAVLEYRLIYRRWPRAGDAFVLHTALGEVSEKTHTLIHWMLDPTTGQPWATTEAVAVTFDLDTRKVIPAAPAHLDALKTLVPAGLGV
ncbi:MAG: thioesterase family protein [Pseudomonadota bacterium]